MKSFFVSSIFFLNASVAVAFMPVAKPPCDSLLQAASFVSVEQLGDSFAPMKAAVDLQNCSGSFVSDQGHILTASHCLGECLENDVWKDRKPREKICEIMVNGKRIQAKVVLASKCDPEKMIQATANGKPTCPDQGDVAILKPLEPVGDFNCLSLSSSAPKVGQSVMAMGRPQRTFRGSGNSGGDGLYVTGGDVVNSETCIRQTAAGTDERVPFKGATHMNKRFLQTTADMNTRQSGGPLLNDDNQIIGVTMAFMPNVHNTKTECKGATYYQPLRVLKTMAQQWGSSAEVASMKCSAKRVNFKH